MCMQLRLFDSLFSSCTSLKACPAISECWRSWATSAWAVHTLLLGTLIFWWISRHTCWPLKAISSNSLTVASRGPLFLHQWRWVLPCADGAAQYQHVEQCWADHASPSDRIRIVHQHGCRKCPVAHCLPFGSSAFGKDGHGIEASRSPDFS